MKWNEANWTEEEQQLRIGAIEIVAYTAISRLYEQPNWTIFTWDNHAHNILLSILSTTLYRPLKFQTSKWW